ncbi:MAG: DUF3105 domain-containing protein [Actinomycetota bacterium]|nr:DUF3105 domain-containing protein [Actinomycetota bacterium]
MAKKRSQKKPAQPGVDPNEKRRERLEAKRAAKAKALAEQRKRAQRERLIRRVVLLGLLVFAGWFLFVRPAAPDEINGHPINDFSTAGANQHTDGPVSYQDSPPVSGQHAPQSVDCGVYAEPVPNESMVHNLEHGAVGLLYRPDTNPEDIKTLESIVGEYEDSVFSMPYVGTMDSPITIAAWGHTMELDSAERDSVREFIDEFRRGGDAPEANTPNVCEHREPEPFEPAEAEGDAEATPSPGAEDEATPEASPSKS